MSELGQKYGVSLVKQAAISKRQFDSIESAFMKELQKLNAEASDSAGKIYREVISTLETVPGTQQIINTMDNLSRSAFMISRLEYLQDSYRKAYDSFFRAFRRDFMKALADKETRVAKVVEKIGVTDDRTGLNQETYDLLESIHTQGYKQINQMLMKWKNFVYDRFFDGVTQGMAYPKFLGLFFNDNGSLRIGSSLEEDSQNITAGNLVAQRTAYVRSKAKENGYEMCWNANPMDNLTKIECLMASMAGVITEDEMSDVYGFPPRFVCRCDLVYTGKEWTDVNAGVNKALEERRIQLVDDLKESPKQKPFWYRMGTKIVPNNAARASGKKMYKIVEKKLTLLKKSVPEWKTSALVSDGLEKAAFEAAAAVIAVKEGVGYKE